MVTGIESCGRQVVYDVDSTYSVRRTQNRCQLSLESKASNCLSNSEHVYVFVFGESVRLGRPHR